MVIRKIFKHCRMKLTQEIINLIKQFPNDQQLGEELRKIYWTQFRKKDKSQLNLFK